MKNKEEAQRRVDRIQAFREELNDLEEQKVLRLSPEQKDSARNFHKTLIADLTRQFDTDLTEAEKKLTGGMKVLTFLGGTALCSSVFFFFYRMWGLIPVPGQILLLVSAPILFLLLMEFFAKREKTLYYATLAGMLAFLCFVLNLTVLGSIFNIAPSPNAFLAWGLLAVIIAYNKSQRLLLTVGLLCILGYLAAKLGSIGGVFWFACFERPENFTLAGGIMIDLPVAVKRLGVMGFACIYHLIGLLSMFISILVLSFVGNSSYLDINEAIIEGGYQLAGFILSGLTIWIGIRNKLGGVQNIGVTFFTLYLYMKFFDWWWELLPIYLFFLLVSLITIGLLALFKRLRANMREAI